MSGRSVNLTTLFLGRLRPPKRLTSTSCTYFRQQLPFLKKAEGETKLMSQDSREKFGVKSQVSNGGGGGVERRREK